MTTVLADDAGRAVAVRIRRLVVEVRQGPDAGARAQLNGRTLGIGAAAGNDLVLSDPGVSRFHCKVEAGEQGYRLIDRDSANGTTIGSLRVHDAYLFDGARIGVGDSELVVQFEDEESEVELWPEERFGGAVGQSVKMRELFARARRAAASDATVLLLGETGTGKDVIARAMHGHSSRAAGPFEVLDCGAVAPSLIEAHIFGHVRGAFTGADVDRPGVFERAHGGTLFLDELGELALELQPKLLRVLETGTVTRVGGTGL